jgi:uncharacterized protein
MTIVHRSPLFKWGPVLLCLLASLATHSLAGAAASFGDRLAAAAMAQTKHKVRYDPAYVELEYPWGDVPADQGVCTDVVVRAYRQLGIDLQRLVNWDMASNFGVYPTKWGLNYPDPNIDHRRVLNLQVFLSRMGAALPVSNRPEDYRPGDLVTWTIPPDLPHIGIVSNRRGAGGRYKIIHNIGKGPKLEDRLFDFPITGHYRFNVEESRRMVPTTNAVWLFGQDF